MKKILKIDRDEFLIWAVDERDFNEEIIDCLLNFDGYSITLQHIWDNMGYVQKRFILNPEVVDKDDWADGEEIEEPSAKYEAVFVKTRKK